MAEAPQPPLNPVEQQKANEDFSRLLLEPDAAAEAAPETTTTPAPETKVDEPATAAEGVTTEAKVDDAATQSATAGQQQNVPGTADKALQKMQQDLSATQRLLDNALTLLNSGQTLSPKQRQQVEQAPRKIQTLKDAIAKRGSFDPFEDGDMVAEAIDEQDGDVSHLRQTVGQLTETVTTLQEQITFDRLATAYAGVDVRKVWDKAVADAAEYREFGAAAYQKRADELFHTRCANAVAAIKAKTGTAAAPSTATPTTSTKPSPTPITPGGASVTTTSTPPSTKAPASANDRYMQDYMKLVE